LEASSWASNLASLQYLTSIKKKEGKKNYAGSKTLLASI